MHYQKGVPEIHDQFIPYRILSLAHLLSRPLPIPRLSFPPSCLQNPARVRVLVASLVASLPSKAQVAGRRTSPTLCSSMTQIRTALLSTAGGSNGLRGSRRALVGSIRACPGVAAVQCGGEDGWGGASRARGRKATGKWGENLGIGVNALSAVVKVADRSGGRACRSTQTRTPDAPKCA